MRKVFYGILQHHDFAGAVFKREKRSIGMVAHRYEGSIAANILVPTLLNKNNDWYSKRYIPLNIKKVWT